MKILWYVNIIMPDAAKELGLEASTGGGWLIGQANALSNKQIELFILTVSSNVKQKTTLKTGKITYIILPVHNEMQTDYNDIINSVNPDIVHIFGTEYQYNTQLINFCCEKNIKNVVSIQGLMHKIAKHFCDGLPPKFNKVNPIIKLMKNIYMADSIALAKKDFETQGEKEISALKRCQNVIGRTHWDKQCVTYVNQNIRYFCVNENLRDTFYNSKIWSWDTCQKHSIFISQGFYPIKGLHQLLPAISELKKEYPDIKLYIGGQTPFTTNNKFLDVFVDLFFEYQKYIKTLIKKYSLQQNIEYLGFIDEKTMQNMYLSANVFVSPSTIENSSNSIAEAMMCGTPVVASNVGGTQTIFDDGKDGILYDFHNTKQLVDAIKTIFDNKDIAQTFSENAIKHANITHNREQNTNQLLSVYNTILEE